MQTQAAYLGFPVLSLGESTYPYLPVRAYERANLVPRVLSLASRKTLTATGHVKPQNLGENIEDITWPRLDTNFIFECSSRYRLEHSKIKIRIHKWTCNILFIANEATELRSEVASAADL